MDFKTYIFKPLRDEGEGNGNPPDNFGDVTFLVPTIFDRAEKT